MNSHSVNSLVTPCRPDCPVCAAAKNARRSPIPLIVKTAVETILADGTWWKSRRTDHGWLARVFAALWSSKLPVVELRMADDALYAKFLVPATDMPIAALETAIGKLRAAVREA